MWGKKTNPPLSLACRSKYAPLFYSVYGRSRQNSILLIRPVDSVVFCQKNLTIGQNSTEKYAVAPESLTFVARKFS